MVGSKAGLGLELASEGVELLILWSLRSVDVGFGLVLYVDGVYSWALLRLVFVFGVVCLL